MAFLIDREIAAESEDEFDAEGDRYEELKSRLFGGKTMKYEEMEELLAAAKSRNDQRVIDALKNVVDDPPTDGAGPLAEDDGFVFNPDDPKADDLFVKADRYEETAGAALKAAETAGKPVSEASDDIFRNSPAMAVLISALQLKYKKTGNVFYAFMPNRPEQQVFIQIKGSRKLYKVQVSPATAEEQAYWEKRGGFEMFQPQAGLDESSAADDPTGKALDLLTIALDGLKGRGDLTADDAWIEDSDKLVLSYENVGWYEGLGKWAEDPQDDVESDLTKIYDALLESGYGLQYSRKAVEKAIADAAVEAASDPEHITPKENRFGDWDSVATCNVYVPFEIVDGPADVLSEEEIPDFPDDEFKGCPNHPVDNKIPKTQYKRKDKYGRWWKIVDKAKAKEDVLPDNVVNEAVETLRRMY